MTAEIFEPDIDPEDWITGTSYVQCRVTIHRNPAMWADLEPLYAQIEAVEAEIADLEKAQKATERRDDESSLGEPNTTPTAPAGEESLGDTPAQAPTLAAARARLDDLAAQAEALYERYDADREVWTLRALDPTEVAACMRASGDQPVEPKRVSKDASKNVIRRRMREFEVYHDQMRAWRDEVNLRCVQAATLGVVVGGVEKPAPSLDGMRRLITRPSGASHLAQLNAALETVTLREGVIPAPKSRRGSGSAPTSS